MQSIADSCPDESFFTCLNQGVCEALSPEHAAEGLSLWSQLLGCVSERCLGGENPCEAEEAACEAEPECLALQACTRQECTCLGGNEGLACLNACVQAHPKGEDAWRDLLMCVPG